VAMRSRRSCVRDWMKLVLIDDTKVKDLLVSDYMINVPNE
jgi:hypothetical protein